MPIKYKSTVNAASWVEGPATIYKSFADHDTTNVDISVLDKQKFYIGFRWINTESIGVDQGLILDDIVIRSTITLPIELLNQNVVCLDGSAKFTWSTATEINNAYFTIERSVDGEIFKEVGQVQGAGNSSEVINYSFVDDNLDLYLYYYRLKQTDFDGKFTIKPILSLNCKKEVETNLTIGYGSSQISTTLNNPIRGNVYTINLISITGAIVKTNIVGDFDNEINYVIDKNLVSSGMYFISFQSETDFFIEKIEIQHNY